MNLSSRFTSALPRPVLVDRSTPVVIYGRVKERDGSESVVVLKKSTLGERDADFDEILRTKPNVISAWCGKSGGWARVTQPQTKLARVAANETRPPHRRPPFSPTPGPSAA